MTSSKLNLNSLRKALLQLNDAIELYHSSTVQNDHRLLIHMRAAVIQAFEFTYELSWKMLKRYLEMSEPNPLEVEQMSFPNLIRTGNERGLLKSDVSVWLEYRKERGATSHTYDEAKAQAVLESIPSFLSDAQFLYEQLQKHG